MKKNGVSAPEKEGSVKKVWDICGELMIQKGSAPTKEEVLEQARKANLSEGTTATQYSCWCRFNGIDSRAINRKPKPAKVEA